MSTLHENRLRPFQKKMMEAAVPEAAVAAFKLHLERLVSGESALLGESSIRPIGDLPDAEGFTAHAVTGEKALDRLVVIKLNGGLGTGMGLDHAKSLIPVREGLTFLDLIARQVLDLRRRTGTAVPLLLMNSYRTRDDSLRLLQDYPDLQLPSLPIDFLQHRIPKILELGLTPAVHPSDPELEWCPPGHGDVYPALLTSGLLDRLLDAGKEFVFVSNADNLGASVDPALLGYMVESGARFMMEVADRTTADQKGGHLCRTADGRLALRESAQCPADEVDTFQDIQRHRYFNTNNLWLHLPTLCVLLESNRGVLPLPTLINRKTLDPREPSSPGVIQLETAAGAALSLFPESEAVRVPRHRFSPVKTTNDLLVVRSDAYVLDAHENLVLDSSLRSPPAIDLDPGFFKLIDEFDRRFDGGPPSLLRCDSLTVRGNIFFGGCTVVRGDACVVGPDSRVDVEAGTILEGRVDLRTRPTC